MTWCNRLSRMVHSIDSSSIPLFTHFFYIQNFVIYSNISSLPEYMPKMQTVGQFPRSHCPIYQLVYGGDSLYNFTHSCTFSEVNDDVTTVACILSKHKIRLGQNSTAHPHY